MTDLSKLTLTELEAELCDQAWKHNDAGKAIDAVNAEIERRKSEPDWAAWEPKWQAFREALKISGMSYNLHEKKDAIRALIAAHNTPLAGGWMVYQPVEASVGPEGVSIQTHEIENFVRGKWKPFSLEPIWNLLLYRYRPRQP